LLGSKDELQHQEWTPPSKNNPYKSIGGSQEAREEEENNISHSLLDFLLSKMRGSREDEEERTMGYLSHCLSAKMK
jgi:hypothetical protein